MTEDLIRKTTAGDVPGVPTIDDILKMTGAGNGWDSVLKTAAGKPMDDSVREKREQLERDYQATFATPHGQRVLEDLFDQTFRRAVTVTAINGNDLTIEKVALYAAERNGQNNTVFYVCKMIDAGTKLGTPSAQKKRRKGAA